LNIVDKVIIHLNKKSSWYIFVKPLTNFYMHRRRKFKRASAPSNATLSLLGKELGEANLGDLLETTSQIGGLLANPIDPLCATLVYNIPVIDVINAPISTLNFCEKVAPKNATPSLSQQLKPRYVIFEIYNCIFILCLFQCDLKKYFCHIFITTHFI